MAYFSNEKIEQFYPSASDLMIPAMKIWKTTAGQEAKLAQCMESGDYFAQEKKDGCFYQFVKTEGPSYLFSRATSTVTGLLSEKGGNVPHVMDALSCLPPKTILIGEIFYPGGTSRHATTIMGCLAKTAIERQKDNPIHYYVHDMIMYNGNDLMFSKAIDRYNILKDAWLGHGLDKYDFLHLAEIVEEDMQTYLANILASGGEGIVMKKKDAVYEPDRRPAWSTIKIKQSDAADLVCIGFCDPTKEYTGKDIDTWPYWEDGTPITKYYHLGWKTAIRIGAYNDNGEMVELGTVSSGLTDDVKEDMTNNPDKYLNKVVSLSCMSIDKTNKTLRHPALSAWREDKDAKDCKISEIFR